MKKKFDRAAFAICGATFLLLPVKAQAADKINRARYYWCSPAKLAQQIQSTGAFYSLRDANGSAINFTDMNLTGIKPSWHSGMVWMGFGQAPPVTLHIVDRVTYNERQEQRGKKQPVVLIDHTAPAKKTIWVEGSAAARPVLFSSEIDQKKNLG